MSETIYSHTLRILSCQGCGAPLDATIDGGRFECGFCGVFQVLERRDETSDLAQASARPDISESERHTRLRAQDEAGTPLPPSVRPFLVDGRLPPSRVQDAKAAWIEARRKLSLAASFPIAEKLFHLTLVLAPHAEERERRATLETAVEVLPDPGHRHVLRCMLAQLAALAGGADAAEQWLAPCDRRPLDLLMDSAYRVAASSLASIRGDHTAVLEALGHTANDVPLARASTAAATYLRCDALERLGDLDSARNELRAHASVVGLTALRAQMREIGLPDHCPDSLAFLEAEDAKRKSQRAIEEARRALDAAELASSRHAVGPPVLTLVLFAGLAATLLSAVLTVPWTFITTRGLEQDPLLGAHSHIYCPLVCDGCTGPYGFVRSSSGAHPHNHMFCQQPSGPNGALRPAPRLTNSSLQVGLSMIPCGWPVGLLLLTPLGWRYARARRTRGARLEDTLRRARARYRSLLES